MAQTPTETPSIEQRQIYRYALAKKSGRAITFWTVSDL
jgi:hypothetical protein